MRIFETPKMNIARFDVENIITTSTPEEQTKTAAATSAETALTTAGIKATNIFKFNE